MILADSIFFLPLFDEYRTYCRTKGYCEPWHPYVGNDYGSEGSIRLLYLGGAAWWSDENHLPSDAAEAREVSRQATYDFIEGGAYESAFWRLLRRIAVGVFDQNDWNTFLASIAWSNLTKTGLVGQTAPPNSDGELVRLDCQLLRHELDVLKPDLVLCVSGSIMPSVGRAIFGQLRECSGCSPKTGSTWFREFADGSKLMWTMHPAYKSKTWGDTVVRDIAMLAHS